MANRSTFPTTIDQFVEHYELQSSDKPLVIRFQELKLKPSLTSNESDELASLTTQLRDKLITAEDFNKLQDAITNLETFFRDNVDGYVQQSKSEITVSKDSALASIEQKKENVITYMDSTTAGAIRNDMGVMGDLTTTDKTSLVKAINEVGAKAPSDASTTVKGIVMLEDSVTSTSVTKAATPKSVKAVKDAIPTLNNTVTSTSTTQAATANSVKTAMDRADAAFLQANDQKTKWAAVIGSPLLASDTSTVLQSKTQTAKNNLGTAIRAKGGVVNDTDALDVMASAVGTMPVKKTASGTVACATTASLFTLFDGTNSSVPKQVVVTGLTFKPSYILLKVNASISTAYDSRMTVTTRISCVSPRTVNSPSNWVYQEAGLASVTSTGFTLPIHALNAGDVVSWVAFE